MPHKRTKEAKQKRAPAATFAVAMAHSRQREAAVDLREEDVRRREDLAPDLNIDLMILSGEMRTTLQMATNLAGHHLTDDHEEKALGASSAINKRASSPPLRAAYSPCC